MQFVSAVSIARRSPALLRTSSHRLFQSVTRKCSTEQESVVAKVPVPAEKRLKFDQITHTGQAWDDEDIRMARFVDGKKLVNPNIAMHLIAQVPPTPCKERIVSCDGGGGALGHPKVYINLVRFS
ncbi:unnamed protein product [Soboliphyme baturini]|uniref:Zf-CHCC domain-containing protein n=1 Tax=Soboliphyme baturini TaxID=241478 RepID=A0A183ICQ4_9BILA|nr:unnamed protein product [Soboliphyme baturini]